MAPKFGRGSATARKAQITDARQIIQQNKNHNRSSSESQIRRFNQQKRITAVSLASRLGNNNGRINKRKVGGGLTPQLAVRIGNNGRQTNFGINKNRNILTPQGKQGKKVIFKGKKLLVTSKQSPRIGNNPLSRVSIDHSSIEGIEDYLMLPNTSTRSALSGLDSPMSISPVHRRSSTVQQISSSFATTTRSTRPTTGNNTLLVSNLHPTVSEDDIIELFSDVGPITSAKLQHPGTAVITYDNKEDAAKALEVYHNRLLDGQPMQCSILNIESRSSKIASRLGGRVQPVASFSNFSLANVGGNMSRNGALQFPKLRQDTQQDVTFTVKLP